MSYASASTDNLDLSQIGSSRSETDIVVETPSAVGMRIIVGSIGLTMYFETVAGGFAPGSLRLI